MPIGPNAPKLGPASELSTLGCSSTHSNTLHDLQRTTKIIICSVGPDVPTTGPDPTSEKRCVKALLQLLYSNCNSNAGFSSVLILHQHANRCVFFYRHIASTRHSGVFFCRHIVSTRHSGVFFCRHIVSTTPQLCIFFCRNIASTRQQLCLLL